MWGEMDHQICVRMTEVQYEKVAERSKLTGKRKSDVIRELIDEGLSGTSLNKGQKNSEGTHGLAANTLAI